MKFKKAFKEFAKKECDPADDATAIRQAFIERHALPLVRRAMGMPADWWTVPIQRMYESDKKVGIVHPIRSKRLAILDWSAPYEAITHQKCYRRYQSRIDFHHMRERPRRIAERDSEEVSLQDNEFEAASTVGRHQPRLLASADAERMCSVPIVIPPSAARGADGR